jgi:flagellar hook-associated protein 2
VDVGDGTLDSVVSAINSQSNFKLSASAIQVGTNSYRLQLTASEPGAANAVTFTAAQFSGGGTWLHPTTGADAQITVGTGADSFQIKGSSNVLANVLPGVTISLNNPTTTGQSVTVSSQRDPDAIATRIQTMVTDLNAVILEITKQTKYDPTTKTAAPLLQNSAVRQIRQQLAQAVSGDATNNAGLAGISFDKDGTILFDKAKFADQMAKNPVGTQALFNDGTNPGLGKRLVDTVSNALDPDTGYLVGSQKSVQDTVSAMQTTIDGMQLRLDRRQIELKNQFTAMETALNTLKSQGSWLSSQLGSSTGG